MKTWKRFRDPEWQVKKARAEHLCAVADQRNDHATNNRLREIVKGAA
ncbi:hypothetical protein [Rhodococcus marinonascens]|nr:hypothetical protein [Rhodococcus marinonascens]